MSLADTKTIYGTAGTEGDGSSREAWVKVDYNFTNDGGAISDLDVFTAGADLVVTDFYYDVTTAILPATTVALDLGVTDGETSFWSNKASSALTLNSGGGMDTAAPIRVNAAQAVVLGIESQAITAGVISFFFKVRRII